MKKLYSTSTNKYVKREEGDVWEESGKTWTIKNGVKRTVTKMDSTRKQFLVPLACPNCGGSMKSHWDAKFWKTHRTCYDCVIQSEHVIRTMGMWKEYEKSKVSANAKAFLQEVKTNLDDYYNNLSAANSRVTEKGKVEKWRDPNEAKVREYIDNEIKKLEEKVNAFTNNEGDDTL